MAADIFSDLEKSTCVKSLAVKPSVVTSSRSVISSVPTDFGGIYTNPAKDDKHRLSNNAHAPSKNWRMLLSCPSGTDAVHLSKFSGEMMCMATDTVPVQHIVYSCNEGDVLSQNFGGNRCLSIEVTIPEMDCAEGYKLSKSPDAETSGECTSTRLQAQNPQCPLNTRLVGRLKSEPVCEEYIQYEAVLHCHNLNEGVDVQYSSIETEHHGELPVCSYSFDEWEYEVSPIAPMTRREKMDARISARRQGKGNSNGHSDVHR
eukprot:Lankesteria_metandrocarpae@DN2056_c0_g1_i1.p1